MAGSTKSFDESTEATEFPNGRERIVSAGGVPVGLATFHPGWRWSNDVRPLMGTERCPIRHVGYALSGRLHVEVGDGSTLDVSAGEVCESRPATTRGSSATSLRVPRLGRQGPRVRAAVRGGCAMSDGTPIITFRASVRSAASPEAIYDLLSDPRTTWSGAGARRRRRTSGCSRWTPRQVPGRGRRVLLHRCEHQRNVPRPVDGRGGRAGRAFRVRHRVDAHPQARQDVARAVHPPVRAREHAGGDGDLVHVRGVAAELRPLVAATGIRSMTRRQVPRMMQKHLENLANMAMAAARG